MTFRAMSGAFLQHWLLTARPAELAFNAFNQLATVAVIAWLARLSGRGEVIAVIAFGVVFMVVWRAAVFHVGGLVNGAFNQGTLELEMMSRAPIVLVMLGKTLAAVSFFGTVGIGGFALVLLIGGAVPTVARPELLLPTLIVSTLAVVSTAFLFAPLAFLVGGRGGCFNAIVPIGVVLGGFVQPIGLLPLPVEVLARLLATAWAMEGLSLVLEGGPLIEVAARWLVSLALSAATFALVGWLFVRAEGQLRTIGSAS